MDVLRDDTQPQPMTDKRSTHRVHHCAPGPRSPTYSIFSVGRPAGRACSVHTSRPLHAELDLCLVDEAVVEHVREVVRFLGHARLVEDAVHVVEHDVRLCEAVEPDVCSGWYGVKWMVRCAY